jgi:hypothetical protein
MLLDNAADKIQRYNQFCLHYNFVADAVYQELRRLQSPFFPRYEPYLIAALIAFDMGRMLGKGLTQRYDITAGGFATRLHQKLTQVRPYLEPIIRDSLFEIDLVRHSTAIVKGYNGLASGGGDGLSDRGSEFHVGATKILHFLNPELFMIIDRNAARVLRAECGVSYKDTTQPGYSGDLYVCSLATTKDLILSYGVERFRSLEPGMPIMRIFDKIAFAHNVLV